MARGKKRRHSKISGKKENEAPKAPRTDRSTIVMKNTEWMPVTAVDYYRENQDIEERLRQIDKTATLVGPFRVLKGESTAVGIDLIMLDREATDLPEMQTFLKCAVGRYAFWRDSPSQEIPMIVFVDLKTVPEVTVVGKEMNHAILDFCEKSLMFGITKRDKKSVTKAVLNTENDDVLNGISTDAKKFIRIRKFACIGGYEGWGRILLALENGMTGYRVLDKEPAALELLLRSLRLVGIREHEQRVGEIIKRIFAETMSCNEQGLYKNALELGHLLFLANKDTINPFMRDLLKVAYTNLGYLDFIQILELTLEQRDIGF